MTGEKGEVRRLGRKGGQREGEQTESLRKDTININTIMFERVYITEMVSHSYSGYVGFVYLDGAK